MSSYLSSAREAILEAVREGLGSEEIRSHDVQDMERLDWKKMVDRWNASSPGGMQPPWVVIHPGALTPASFALGYHAHFLPLTIWFIQSIAVKGGAALDTGALRTGIEDALLEVLDAVLHSGSEAYQVFEHTLDLSEGNAANEFFLSNKHMYWAGALTLRVLVGVAA